MLSSFSFLSCTTRSAISRHRPPRRTVLGQVDSFVLCEVVGSQIALDGIQPRDTRMPWWSLPVFWQGSRWNHLGICVIVHACNMPRVFNMRYARYKCLYLSVYVCSTAHVRCVVSRSMTQCHQQQRQQGVILYPRTPLLRLPPPPISTRHSHCRLLLQAGTGKWNRVYICSVMVLSTVHVFVLCT